MPKYTVNQIVYFSAAHVLRDYPLACEKLHGHNYKVIIEVEAEKLDNIGMVIDYVELDAIANKYIGILDHQHLNNIEPFDKINPTTENVAKWLYDKISVDINDSRKQLASITIWENHNNFIKYA